MKVDDMVTYYNSMAMYRQPGVMSAGSMNGPIASQFHHPGSPSAASWAYTTGYHQPAPHQMAPAGHGHHQHQAWPDEGHHQVVPPPPPPPSSWHHAMYPQEFADFSAITGPAPGQNVGQQILGHETTLPSPPITVSGSDLSSPGGGTGGGSVSPPQQQPRGASTSNISQGMATRPGARSPYDWMKKQSYQSQPNPEIAPLSSTPSILDFTNTDLTGKTRTKDKYRVVYTDHQRLELEKEFHYSRYITIRRKAELAGNLGLSERQVKIWFQNRRAKERKQVKKRDELQHKEYNIKMEPTTHEAAMMAAMSSQTQLHHHQNGTPLIGTSMHGVGSSGPTSHPQLHQVVLHQQQSGPLHQSPLGMPD